MAGCRKPRLAYVRGVGCENPDMAGCEKPRLAYVRGVGCENPDALLSYVGCASLGPSPGAKALGRSGCEKLWVGPVRQPWVAGGL